MKKKHVLMELEGPRHSYNQRACSASSKSLRRPL